MAQIRDYAKKVIILITWHIIDCFQNYHIIIIINETEKIEKSFCNNFNLNTIIWINTILAYEKKQIQHEKNWIFIDKKLKKFIGNQFILNPTDTPFQAKEKQ